MQSVFYQEKLEHKVVLYYKYGSYKQNEEIVDSWKILYDDQIYFPSKKPVKFDVSNENDEKILEKGDTISFYISNCLNDEKGEIVCKFNCVFTSDSPTYNPFMKNDDIWVYYGPVHNRGAKKFNLYKPYCLCGFIGILHYSLIE